MLIDTVIPHRSALLSLFNLACILISLTVQEVRLSQRQQDQPMGHEVLHEHVGREALLGRPQQAQGVLPPRNGHPGVTRHLPGQLGVKSLEWGEGVTLGGVFHIKICIIKFSLCNCHFSDLFKRIFKRTSNELLCSEYVLWDSNL